ncbi:MAG: hypothetical protein QM719_10045 [Thermomonas sp.]
MNTKVIIVCWLVCASSPVFATTWAETKIKDPIDGKQCAVQTPMSSGSYIYQWPEKYDQIFWPLTDPNGVWACPASGFATFIGDEGLSAEEKAAISAFLKDAPPLPKDATSKIVLDRLRSIYSLRKPDPTKKIGILRALAYQYQSIGMQDIANALRAQAAEAMEERLADEKLDPALRLQYLFVTANYAREFGRADESDRKLEQLTDLFIDAASDEKLKDYAEYLQALVESARKIAPGGVLAPAE